MQMIPLQAIPAQTVGVLLNQQAAVITLRQLRTGLYLNLALGTTEIVGLVICRNLDRIVRNAYLGFAGDLFFWDSTGVGDNPDFTGLGNDFTSRFQLVYVTEGELPDPADNGNFLVNIASVAA